MSLWKRIKIHLAYRKAEREMKRACAQYLIKMPTGELAGIAAALLMESNSGN